MLIRNAYLIRIATLENHNKTNVSTQITRFNPKRLLEPKHILFYYRADCLTFGRRRSGLRQVTKTSKMLDNKIC